MATSTLEYQAVERSGKILVHYSIWVGTLFCVNAVLLVFLCYYVPHMRDSYKIMKSPMPVVTELVFSISTGYANHRGWVAALLLVFLLAAPLAYATARVEPEALRRRRVKILVWWLSGLTALFVVLAGVALWMPLLT